jgi:hypothetical protein
MMVRTAKDGLQHTECKVCVSLLLDFALARLFDLNFFPIVCQ